MVEDWEIEAHKLVDTISRLEGDHRKAMKYFLTFRSVGDIIALRELKEKYGISDPERVVMDLIDRGLLERGEGCINLPSPLRRFLGRRHGRIDI